MESDEQRRVREILSSMEESARPAFEDKDIDDLHILIEKTVRFHDYLRSAPPWPQFPDDPAQNTRYMLDEIFIQVDSFQSVMDLYNCLVGARTSTIDWNVVAIQSIRDRFLSMYEQFLAEAEFEVKCRLLLDLFKLEIVFAGAFYES